MNAMNVEPSDKTPNEQSTQIHRRHNSLDTPTHKNNRLSVHVISGSWKNRKSTRNESRNKKERQQRHRIRIANTMSHIMDNKDYHHHDNDIDDSMICTICGDIFSDPTCLSCPKSHTFCLVHLEALI